MVRRRYFLRHMSRQAVLTFQPAFHSRGRRPAWSTPSMMFISGLKDGASGLRRRSMKASVLWRQEYKRGERASVAID